MQSQKKWLGLSSLVILLDQVSKIIMESKLTLYQSINVMPFFNFTLAYNEGAAFSFLGDAGGWQRWFFVVLSIVISIILIVWLLKLTRKERWTSISLSLILGGAIGNLIDRILYGHVIDFIDWFYLTDSSSCLPAFFRTTDLACHWPIFNIADSAISIGVVILLTSSLFIKDTKENPDNA